MKKINWISKQGKRWRMQQFLFLFFLFAGPSLIIKAHYASRADDKKGIHFLENKWAEAIKRGASQNKYIFLEFYASWCPYCNKLSRTTFQNKEVGAFFNQNFVNVSLDFEKGDGATLADSMDVRATPTLLILSPDGKPVLKSIGYLDADELINFGNTVIHPKQNTQISH